MKQFFETVSKHNLINPGDRIVVGVSGGPDSICLLHLLWKLKEKMKLEIYGVHLNHQFRGGEADRDAEYVKSFCHMLKIESYIFSEDVKSYSKKRGITFEEGGRKLRYDLFEQVAKETNSNKIAVAQNRNDQAETVLMRLIRGSGLEGLTAIDYIRDGKIIRPLLDISREEIEEYCRKYKLNPRIDKTNLETIYTRNKIRLELIPYIEKNFNPNIIDTLWRSSNILRDDSEYLNNITENIYKAITNKKDNGLSINLTEFIELHIALKKRIIRKVLENIKGNLKDIGLVHIDNIINLSKNNNVGARIDLPGHIIVELGYNSIDIKIGSKEKSSKAIEKFEYSLKKNDSLYIKEINGTIKNLVMDKKDIDMNNRDKYSIYINYNKVQGNFIIRNRKNGDKFSPLGMKGSKKLKDFFIDEKVPKDIRNTIPILCDESGIIWVIGYRISEKYKLDNRADRVIKLTYEEGCIEN